MQYNIHMTLNKAFAMRTSELLLVNKMSKYRLQKLTGLSHTAMTRVFNEHNQDCKLSTIAKVVAVFNLTLAQFFDSKFFDLDKISYE